MIINNKWDRTVTGKIYQVKSIEHLQISLTCKTNIFQIFNLLTEIYVQHQMAYSLFVTFWQCGFTSWLLHVEQETVTFRCNRPRSGWCHYCEYFDIVIPVCNWFFLFKHIPFQYVPHGNTSLLDSITIRSIEQVTLQ